QPGRAARWHSRQQAREYAQGCRSVLPGGGLAAIGARARPAGRRHLLSGRRALLERRGLGRQGCGSPKFGYQARLSARRNRVRRMAITISSSFDAGNIRVVNNDGDRFDLEIVTDHLSDFYLWFYFRVAGAAGREVTLRITNCAASAYPNGWPDYKGVMSLDRDEWVRIIDTSYADG